MKLKNTLITLVILLVVSGCGLQTAPANGGVLPTDISLPTDTPLPDGDASQPEHAARSTYQFVLFYGPNQAGFDGAGEFDTACQNELGEDSRQADWIDLEFYNHDGYSLEDLADQLGLEGDAFVWITLATQNNFNGSDAYALINNPTGEMFYDGLDALPNWSDQVFVLSHRPSDPMLPWLPVLCIMEEQPNKMP